MTSLPFMRGGRREREMHVMGKPDPCCISAGLRKLPGLRKLLAGAEGLSSSPTLNLGKFLGEAWAGIRPAALGTAN